MPRIISALAAIASAAMLASSALAADLPEPAPLDAEAVQRGAEACPLWQPRYGISYVPTNAPCDPTYVGSTMGLSRPSYYGALPGPGYDAP